MTKWMIRCTRCGTEMEFNVAFDLSKLNGHLFIYCNKCKANTEHDILGVFDPFTERFIDKNELANLKFKSIEMD
ncbi:hypothetical protein GCM10007981_19210 [Thermocladium modestius]|uniref:Uncharacterized protein n=1 Tax=Thermocladium modestius TaxID=62609 RepID=A0A830GW71_9CREN|nr:hypothetical protein [Thermocladium modestius]GGP22579.1 hypothetical protein GCM10007981_19210 [Thermocladium modestius]